MPVNVRHFESLTSLAIDNCGSLPFSLFQNWPVAPSPVTASFRADCLAQASDQLSFITSWSATVHSLLAQAWRVWTMCQCEVFKVSTNQGNIRVQFSDPKQLQTSDTPMGRAKFIVNVTITSLPLSLKPSAEQATRQYLSDLAELLRLTLNKAKLTNADFLPISARVKFKLRVTARAFWRLLQMNTSS
jgi:hypothetical protein